MYGLFTQKELTTLTEGLICSFHGTSSPQRVDVDGIAVKRLGLDVRYERFATDDPNCIGFTADGEAPLPVYRKRRMVEVTFPPNTIVLEEYLRHPEEKRTRRFTLAHEMGHILLQRTGTCQTQACFHHMFDKESSYSIQDLQRQLKWEELQANALAAALLMPIGSIRQHILHHTGSGKIPIYGEHILAPKDKLALREIAKELGVSQTTLFIQLRKYKLLSYRPLDEFIAQQGKRGAELGV